MSAGNRSMYRASAVFPLSYCEKLAADSISPRVFTGIPPSAPTGVDFNESGRPSKDIALSIPCPRMNYLSGD